MILSAFAPVFGVPLTLVTTPAMVRASRIYWRRLRVLKSLNWMDWCGFFFVSVAAVLPVSFLGGIAFCCVCTVGGIVDFNLTYPGGGQAMSVGIMYVSIYLGLAAGLLASLFLLKQFNYLSKVEKDALQQAKSAAAPDRRQSESADAQ